MVVCFLSVNTFAHANTAEKHDSQSGEILAMFSRHSLERISEFSKPSTVFMDRSSAEYAIYADIKTAIYHGNGQDKWLHITPSQTPNNFIIYMEDRSGHYVWEQQFIMNGGTTHWFVGANVKTVYLEGVPGGPVTVSVTNH